MGTNFPTALDTLTNPQAGDKLNSPLHTEQHANANDSIEAIESFIGVNGSGLHDRTAKTDPADNDEFSIVDSAASYVMKRLSFLNLKVAIGKFMNPVGTIREFNVSTNPATLLGFGTWSAFGAGRVTVCINASDTEFDTNGETGGEKTHLLTSAESGLKAHAHGMTILQTVGTGAYCAPDAAVVRAATPVDNLGFNTGNNTASDASSAHNNLQPYIVVYRWVRTA